MGEHMGLGFLVALTLAISVALLTSPGSFLGIRYSLGKQHISVVHSCVLSVLIQCCQIAGPCRAYRTIVW